MTKRRLSLLPLVGVLMLAAFPATAAKLPTDGEVRHAMDHIRQRLQAARPALQAQRLDRADSERLANAIDDQLQRLMAHNRLPAEVNVQLMPMVESLREAAQKLRRRDQAGLSQAETALKDYSRDFDHPGWGDAVD